MNDLPFQVIAKSLKEETTVNTEDEMYRLAVELSMKDAAKKSQVTERDDSVPDSEEEQMKLAIERSMNESFGAEPSGLGWSLFLMASFNKSGTYHFCTVHLSAKNFNIGHNFCQVNYRTFIFHMCIPCGKTFSLLSISAMSKPNIKLIFLKKWLLWGQLCLTNTAC